MASLLGSHHVTTDIRKYRPNTGITTSHVESELHSCSSPYYVPQVLPNAQARVYPRRTSLVERPISWFLIRIGVR